MKRYVITKVYRPTQEETKFYFSTLKEAKTFRAKIDSAYSGRYDTFLSVVNK
jgi:hypothetical protein